MRTDKLLAVVIGRLFTCPAMAATSYYSGICASEAIPPQYGIVSTNKVVTTLPSFNTVKSAAGLHCADGNVYVRYPSGQNSGNLPFPIGAAYVDCTSCESGYTLTYATLPAKVTWDAGTYNDGNGGTVTVGAGEYSCTSFGASATYRDCVYNGSSGGGDSGDGGETPDCASSAWSTIKQGYVKRTARRLVNGVCQSTTEYACAEDWYGTPSGTTANTMSGCSHCVSWAGVPVIKDGTTTVTYANLNGTTNGAVGITTPDGCRIDGTGYSFAYPEGTFKWHHSMFGNTCFYSN